MNKTYSLWLVICVCGGLSLWGCGGDGGGDGGNGSGNGNAGSNTGGASCASVCEVLSACPAALVDAASCTAICEQTMSAQCRNCLASSSQCGEDCMAVCSSDGEGEGGSGGNMNNGGGGNSQQGADLGQGCRFSDDCSTNICIGGFIQDGYCSKTCTDFTDCPDFWDCGSNPDGPGQVCLNNG